MVVTGRPARSRTLALPLATIALVALASNCAPPPAPGRDASPPDATADAPSPADAPPPDVIAPACPDGDADPSVGTWVVCAGRCVDTDTDGSNCGGCGRACGAELVCAEGSCQRPCSVGERYCAGACVDARTDPLNCGACGTRCPATTPVCAAGTCAVTAIGSTCEIALDCGDGLQCAPPGLGWADGYCTAACARDADCGPAGAAWCASDGRVSRCLRRCAAPTDCRGGYSCVPVDRAEGPLAGDGGAGGATACLPSCAVDPALVCGPARCDPSTGRCVPRCELDTDCAPASLCDTTVHRCRCTPDTPCGAGLSCYPATGQCGCVDDAVCGRGRTCDRTLGLCRG